MSITMRRMSKNKKYLLWIFLLLPYVLFPVLYFALGYNNEDSAKVSFIIINKADMSLSAYDNKGNIIQKTGVATGKSKGDKLKKGDMKTPEGVFTIADIQSSSSWSHDFENDSLGPIKGAYGPFFIRI